MELSKEVLVLISNEIKDLVCILNENLIIKYINEKIYLKQLNYSNEDLIDKKISNIIIGEDFTKIEELIKEKTQENDKFVDIQMFHKDGSKIWFEVKVQPIEDKKRMKEFLLISRDISEKKFTELIVKDSEEKYQSIIENIKEGYYEVDLKGNFTYVNDALCKFLGYSNRELLIKNFDITTDKQTKNIVYKTFNKVFRTEIRQNIFQFPVFRKNGEQAFFETSVYLKYNSKGRKVGFYGIVRDITERKKEEDLEEKFKIELTQKVRLSTKELEESQEKYRNLFEQSNDGIFLHDLEGKIIDANQKVMDYFGYTKSEILSLNISQLHPTSEVVESKKAFEEITKKGFIVFEINFKKKNGETFPAEVSSSLFTLGEETFIQGEVRDITIRKQAEQKLVESEEKYRNMISNLDLGFFQVSWEGVLLNYNPAFSKMLGFDPKKEPDKLNVKQFWQKPNERDNYLKILEKDRFVKNYIVHSRKRDGQKIVLNLNSHLIDSEPSMIQGVIADVTEKFELEQKVKESESRYRNLFESVPFAIALIDQKGKIIYCNPAVEPLLGYSIEELIGKEFRNLMAIQPDYLPMMLERFQRLLKGEILPPFDAQLYKKKGDLVWINYQTSIVKIDDNILVQAILHDISERKRADLLVQEEIQKLKELDQIRKDLISRVSHELKTPLVSVCGASELLLELFDDKMTKESLELIKMIEKGGSRLKYLVDNLLDITRIEYNKFELMPELTNLSDIIKDCSSELMYLIKQRKLNIKLEFPEEIIINIDRIRIEHVILNLFSNAIKNTPPNGNISIKLYQKKNWIEISITDTGIGLTEEEMGIIFTRFGKIERYEEGIEFIDIQGSGLGLFISKEIVDLHGGTIRAESEGRGKGSTFIVKLPTS